MKNTIIALVLVVASTTTSAQIGMSRMDVDRGGNPSLTAAYFAKDGWEFWAFGADRSDTQDLELGRLYPVGKRWLVGGYGVVWPKSKKLFGVPFAIYQDNVLGGALCLKLGYYVPLNGGPTILFSDESSLLWSAKRGMSWGPILSFSQSGSNKPTARLGLSLRFAKGGSSLELSSQPVYLKGSGAPRYRIEICQKL